MTAVLRRYWPYDEVSISKDPESSVFVLSTPWLKVRLNLPESDLVKAASFVSKLNAGELTGEDLSDVNWFFSNLAAFPVAYILPRSDINGVDVHRTLNSEIDLAQPRTLLRTLTARSSEFAANELVAQKYLPADWSWDTEAALSFSRQSQGVDPQALFSVARRFHLLNDIEWNRTDEMLRFTQALKSDSEKFKWASALILRQNHYITEQCGSVLGNALAVAQGARLEVSDFIQAEAGHDRILAGALKSVGFGPAEVEVISVTKALMEVFRFIAGRNLLAFAMVVDIFERTSYREEDPLTSLLNEGGESAAAKQTDIHREINDVGSHENVAIGFLSGMAAVDESYALEALRLAELATLVIHQLSAQTLEVMREQKGW